MCNPILIYMGVTAVAGGLKAYGQYQQGVATKQYYNYLADSSRMQGEYAYKMGHKQSELIQESAKFKGVAQKTKAAMTASAQRAAMAANGVVLSSVTSEDIASDTMSKARLDELAIRYNADVKSWSSTEDAKYKRWAGNVQGENYDIAGRNAMSAAKTQMFTTLLSTAASVAGTAYFGGLLSGATKTTTTGLSGTAAGGGLKGSYVYGPGTSNSGYSLSGSLLKTGGLSL